MWIVSFWVFPVISACMWLAMLIAMISTWAANGKPHYSNMPASRTIPYVSRSSLRSMLRKYSDFSIQKKKKDMFQISALLGYSPYSLPEAP